MDGARRGRHAVAAMSARPLLLYSRSCQSALRAMARLAQEALARPGTFVNLAALAAATGARAPALAQVLQRLRRAGLLAARRGPSGGVRLSRPPAAISVLEVVRAVDGTGLENRCILGLPACGDAAPCPAHPVWKRARRLLEARLENRSLADLAVAVARKGAILLARRRRRPGRRTAHASAESQ
jgi:Rrf2 family iron-sulfur cluster assembly transcriptional regulator